MELKEIQTLMQNFEDSDMRELNIQDGDFHLYLSKNKQSHYDPQTIVKQQSTKESDPVLPDSNDTAISTNKTIKAPLVGTVYLQPKPNEPAYVNVGDHVQKGDIVCVIEAMKMMTEIKSEFTGVVTGINVTNEELVEVEQPLFTVSED
ncbi:acetyl-CoA carboxylase biotin carboxyl carrier protein subunit [Lactobacillus sp. 0.1XD8-4]|uniref:acetyl-CoA carboxylase biotin carboxyl carrier protein n=1 Tax=uncultured Limosilactobacillus sp. TaxID=2837629 RepID=UPI00129D71BD|nr:biotin/lipoyl-containing protein [uncultured Limosilactobacillus sp.]MRN06942.1 acetyl-CoA carboxylase biotin carboxyl carrier protein subunit [Lactobacillus sp. 0.1XD8-4]